MRPGTERIAAPITYRSTAVPITSSGSWPMLPSRSALTLRVFSSGWSRRARVDLQGFAEKTDRPLDFGHGAHGREPRFATALARIGVEPRSWRDDHCFALGPEVGDQPPREVFGVFDWQADHRVERSAGRRRRDAGDPCERFDHGGDPLLVDVADAVVVAVGKAERGDARVLCEGLHTEPRLS